DSQLGDMGSTRTISGGYWATTIQLYCWVEIAGGGGSGGSGPSGGGHANGFDPYCIDCGDGGDTGGGGVGLLSNIDPELQAITDPNNPGNLFTEDWAKLSQALKQGIANDPVLKKAYDYLVNKQIKTSWQGNSDPRVGYMFTNIDTNGNITVYINPILFRDDQKAKLGISLFEEILHMDQYAYYGETDYATKSPSNMEFEAKFILEYLNKVKNNSLFPNTNTGLYETGAQYNTFNDWLKTLTPAQLTAVGFIKDAYFQYAEKFRAGYAAIAPNHVYAAPLDPNFLPLLLFFFLNN
nr:hypothetical protein [Microscillaceae bacterium]